MTSHKKSILMIVPYFGKWPTYIRFFIESCRWNPSVDWLIITDCGDLGDVPPNVRLMQINLLEYRDLVSERLSIRCQWDSAYKICDIRPAMGLIHSDVIASYDYWGYGDIDVVYGDIRSIYTSDVLTHDIISSHPDRCAGHFVLIRNVESMNRAFKRVRGWRDLLARKAHVSFDERHWSDLFVTHQRITWRERLKSRLRSPLLKVKGYFVEQFSTNLPPLPWIDGTRNYPCAWIWRDGVLTASNGGARTFLYAHFTNWQSGRWLRDGEAAWKDLKTLDHCPPGRPSCFKITAHGFISLEDQSLSDAA
jgi:hypothetical protein